MTKPRLPVGNDIFSKLREENCYYIDKTGLIPALIEDKNNVVTLFTRPRRFGKTLNMSMLDCFFDISRDSRSLFKGLSVSENKEICAEYMNQYPTLFLSFKEVAGNTFEGAFGLMKVILSFWCERHLYLTKSDKVSDVKAKAFERLAYKTASPDEIKSSLYLISEVMYAYYGKPVIILIDEYDVPASYASDNGYYHEMIDVIRSMFSMAFKTNPYLKFAVITGCLRITKESIFTGTNNFKCYSIRSKDFSRYFGFTEPEVKQLLSDCGLSDKADNIKEWYDGYVFGDTEVYCPWDVLNYVSDLMSNETAQPQNYWRNTSHNGIIRQFVDRTDYNVSDKFETLLNGGAIEQRVVEELTYDEVFSKEENLWSMLYMTGYLTKAHKFEQGSTVTLKIPNREVASIFEDTVVNWFNDNIDRSKQSELMQAFWNGNEQRATELLSDFLWKTISYHDYHEDYYHAFLAGMFAGIGYSVESNKEHGLGRPDILLRDRDNRRAMIIEAKRVTEPEEMPKACDEAVKQIVERKYAKSIPNGYRTILCYGVAFCEKDCLIKLLRV